MRLDRPRRGGDRDVDEDRPRALSGEGTTRSFRGLRLDVHRYAALAGTIDGERTHGGRSGDRPRAMRVSVDAWAAAAAEHPLDDPREPESQCADRGHPAHDGGHAYAARQGGARDPRGELRRPRLWRAH